MPAPPNDPAEQGWLRFCYRNWRPTWFGYLHNQAWAWATSLGLLPPIVTTLQVRHRVSGRLQSTVLVPVEHEGHRYVVSMLGDNSEWVLNVRAAGGHANEVRGSSASVILTELVAAERAPVLKAWCQVATSGRRHVPVAPDAPLAEFATIAARYPVFRVSSVDP